MTDTPTGLTAEHDRLAVSPRPEDDWRVWGPYLSARQWGTVREDYSEGGDAWEAFPFDHAHRRAYRWGDDGIAGLTDRYGFFNIATALWNGHDDRLKERLFGLTGPQGNHGEDVKEYWWHLDATPTHSYSEYLYRYPQAAYPYEDLVRVNAERGYDDPEFELADTGVLADDRFFDVTTRHVKASPFDLIIEITATNHGPEAADLDVIPQAWFRNTWVWGRDERRPSITALPEKEATRAVELRHDWLGHYHLVAEGTPDVLFCDNESNAAALGWDGQEQHPHPKDAIDTAIVHGDDSLLGEGVGTKVAFRYQHKGIEPGESRTVRLRLMRLKEFAVAPDHGAAFVDAEAIIERRRVEADDFYDAIIPPSVTDQDRVIARRAFAGLNWSKQVYRYDVREWLEGDPAQPTPPPSRSSRRTGRNADWKHLSLADVILMPDEWEYPWFATWDLAFHCVALAHIDPAFAKEQLVLLCREWAMHPNGQMAAYEWNFSDVNPPVHAWAAWQVYALDGASDHDFLVRIATKLLLNFGWWVNRKDADGTNLFEGGFLGMDNIGAFDRSEPLPDGLRLEQADATSWMAFFCLNLLRMSWELARVDKGWDEVATKFLEHFLTISQALDHVGTGEISMWDEEDGFFYDTVVDDHQGHTQALKVRSMVGLLPLMAVAHEPDWVAEELTDFSARLDWLRHRRPEVTRGVIHSEREGRSAVTLSMVSPDKLPRVLTRMLDPEEFLSPFGLRSLSAAYRGGTSVTMSGQDLPMAYTPGESDNGMFGGNSNWRGPVWFPVNLLLTDALRTYAADEDLSFEYPTGSGEIHGLMDIALALEQRLIDLFRPNEHGQRPGDPAHLPQGPLWGETHPTFSEYFHGDTGAGLGASHQSGWTALVAHLICTTGRDVHTERQHDTRP
ncbi:glucosidase [Janibacter sp. GXQ6167]|uniref:MGH1-like glycoside hydrolase domain-containing protein n=1 Tax=Janibacter sp. GXQ6167 TaxID=3240791 RepID=UPI0035245D07